MDLREGETGCRYADLRAMVQVGRGERRGDKFTREGGREGGRR